MARPRKKLDLVAVAETLAATSADRVTMDRLADLLNVAKPTLYRMAGSREELIAICIDAEAERLLEYIHGGGGGVASGFRAILRFADDSPSGFLLLFGGGYPEARMAVRRVESRLADLLKREARKKPHPDVAHPEVLAAGLVGLASGAARRAAEDHVPLDAEALAAELERVVSSAF
jgi:AcrR family transcriptional regulator